ncbi:TnpC protein (Fragment) OS=mine drainage metagenome GN=B1A_06227 PE=4 SV=1: DDE_Tnp_IS66_C [Gemmata massiliana]|uniref:Transposase IS66 C-terminal domain-containing protein n=1 Tax=Gemmata massiliana TaxID=1210884 RepID=A0A6P2CXE2_9BACT
MEEFDRKDNAQVYRFLVKLEARAVATCKRHGIDPWSYLADVLTHFPSHPTDRVGALLPDAWAQAQRATS